MPEMLFSPGLSLSSVMTESDLLLFSFWNHQKIMPSGRKTYKVRKISDDYYCLMGLGVRDGSNLKTYLTIMYNSENRQIFP